MTQHGINRNGTLSKSIKDHVLHASDFTHEELFDLIKQYEQIQPKTTAEISDPKLSQSVQPQLNWFTIKQVWKTQQPSMWAYDPNPKTSISIQFDTDEDLKRFAIHYKQWTRSHKIQAVLA